MVTIMDPISPTGRYCSIGFSRLSALSIIKIHGLCALANQLLAASAVAGSILAALAILVKDCVANSSELASIQKIPQKLDST